MNKITLAGKFLDQPRLVGKFTKAVPTMLVTGGALYSSTTFEKPLNKKNEKKRLKQFLF